VAAIFHVMTHAFFKALLFLGSGSVIHGMHHEQDMRKMGNLKKYMPITFITMMMGWLAICGIPIWAGFFSKDEILYKTFAAANLPAPWNYVLWVVGLVTAVLTAVYMTRMMWMTFFGTERFHDEIEGEHHHGHAADINALDGVNVSAHSDTHPDNVSDANSDDEDEDEHHHPLPVGFKPHESPWTMWGPLVVLAILATVGGLVGIPYALSGGVVSNVFEQTLEPIIAKVGKPTEQNGDAQVAARHEAKTATEHGEAKPATEAKAAEHVAEVHHSVEEAQTERLLAGLSVLLALSGIGIGIALFGKTPLRKMPKILEDKWRIDELYNGYIVDPITRFSRERLWKGFDVGFIDGIVNGVGNFVMELGSVVRKLQVGYVRSYAAVILVGALIVVGYFIYYGLKLVV
jgi:NADH-quinone oxidoreductase subunit L